MAGLYYEEFVEGHVFDHAFTRTVTEQDNISFSLMTLNPQPLHIDADFASRTEWGKPLFNSLYTLAPPSVTSA
jgi:acyl dehydratase